MSTGQSSLPPGSIKVVPGRSKLRIESTNPVPRGNLTYKSSKVKFVSPQEAISLSSGRVNQMAFSPPRPKSARPTPEKQQPVQAHPTFSPPRPKSARPTPEKQPVQAHPTFSPPRPKSARPTLEKQQPVQAHPTFEAPVLPRPISKSPSTGCRKEIICGLRALSLTPATTVKRTKKTNPSLFQYKTVEPPSPRALQIHSRVKQQASNATQIVQGEVVKGCDRAENFKRIRPSMSAENLSHLLSYRPAKHPIWKGRIIDSAMPPEFDCEFWAILASTIRRKAHKLSKVMPVLLKGEVLPTCHILNYVFARSPTLLNVEIYLFPAAKGTERSKGEHAHLFEAMATRNTMIKVNINGIELLIFSSKVLDETSQYLINTQKKTENFLWGVFLRNKNSLAPRTAYEVDKDVDYGNVVDMDIDTEYPTPGVVLKLIAESQSIPSTSPEKMNREVDLPPGFEKFWAPPLLKLNIQGTSNPRSDLSRSAGLVRTESGKWLFGYTICHKTIPEVAATLLAIHHGLNMLWDGGFRRIRVETTSHEIIKALTTHSELFVKRVSTLALCKDMILKDWECDIYLSKEGNSCAEWLASRSEDQHQGLVFFQYPPRGLMDLLEKDRLATILGSSALKYSHSER